MYNGKYHIMKGWFFMKKRLIAGIVALCIVGGMGVIPKSIAPAVAVATSEETAKSGVCGENLT